MNRGNRETEDRETEETEEAEKYHRMENQTEAESDRCRKTDRGRSIRLHNLMKAHATGGLR